MAEEKGSDHLPKTRRRGRGAVDFCPRAWGRSGLGARLNLRDDCVGVFFMHTPVDDKKRRTEGKSVENSGRASSWEVRWEHWPCSPFRARPQVRAENMGHNAGRLGTWALATSSLPAHY